MAQANKKNNKVITLNDVEALGPSMVETDGYLTRSCDEDFILSLETCGLPSDENFEIIHFSLAYFGEKKFGGKPILCTPVHPMRNRDVSSSTPYNGITNEMVFAKTTPKIAEITAEKIRKLVKGHKIYVWNSEFTNAALASSLIGQLDNLVDVQEEARWDLSIARDCEDPTKYEEPQFNPKAPTWEEVLGRKPGNPEQKIKFIRFVQTAMERGGINNVLTIMRRKKAG